MQLKMQDILGFTTFYETVKVQKLTMKTAYRLAQLAKIVDGELQFYREKLHAIVQEFGEMDEEGKPAVTDDGNGIKLRPGTEDQCFNAMKELQELEVTLPDIKFHIEDFGNVELNMAEMTAILAFIEE
jgi:hypothetical protein